jgi:hypothetical protein
MKNIGGFDMCFETAVGCILLSAALVGYAVHMATRNINWALHMFYFKQLLSSL